MTREGLSEEVWLFPGAAVTKCHKLGDLKQQKLCSHSSGRPKSEVKVLAGLIPPGGSETEPVHASVPWLVAALPPPSSHGLLPSVGVFLCVQISSSYVDTSHWIWGSPYSNMISS